MSACPRDDDDDDDDDDDAKKEKEYGDDEMIVNYRDAVLYGRDLKLLEGTMVGMSSMSSSTSLWLNDGLLHFQLVRLARAWCHRSDPFQDRTSASTTNPRGGTPFLCMDPSVLSFLMMLNPASGSGAQDHHEDDDDVDDDDVEEEELRSIAASHNHFEGVRVFFLPVNDGLAPCTTTTGWPAPATTAQGTHWSLLVAVDVGDVDAVDDDAGPPDLHVAPPATKRRHLAYVHFDSVPGHNASAASALAATWNSLWRVASRATNEPAAASSRGVERSRADAPEASVREGRAPRQANGYDCGVHVLGSVEALLQTTMTTWTNDSHNHFTHDELPNLMNEWEEALRRHFGADPACSCASLRQRMAHDIRALGCAPG
jgi:Ulp1 protease family, C-terminal catalytic domain